MIVRSRVSWGVDSAHPADYNNYRACKSLFSTSLFFTYIFFFESGFNIRGLRVKKQNGGKISTGGKVAGRHAIRLEQAATFHDDVIRICVVKPYLPLSQYSSMLGELTGARTGGIVSLQG